MSSSSAFGNGAPSVLPVAAAGGAPADKLPVNWETHYRALGGAPRHTNIAELLLSGWQEPGRAYHTARHLEECLDLLDRWAGALPCRHVIAVALWFHDYVYDTKGKDNENRCIQAAREVLGASELGHEVIEQVCQLIEVTKHGSVAPTSYAERMMVDIDLAILGSQPERFNEYCRQVRQEFSWVRDIDFQVKRADFLQSMLDLGRIYHSPRAYHELENQARLNLNAEIARLRALG